MFPAPPRRPFVNPVPAIMRLGLPSAASAFLIALILPTPSGAAPRDVAPVWRAGSTLGNPQDRALAKDWMKGQYACQQAIEACTQFETGPVQVPSSGAFLALRTASGGTCGAYELALYGPVIAGRRRRAGQGDAPLLSDCGEALSLRPGGRLPDVVARGFIDRFGADGPALETRLWRWSGREYRIVERSRSAVQPD